MRPSTGKRGDVSASVGIHLADHVLRLVRVELTDRPLVTDAAELRLPPDVIVSGTVIDAPAVADLLRRLWEQLNLTWEPIAVVIGSPDVRLTVLDPASEAMAQHAIEQVHAYSTEPDDSLVIVPLTSWEAGEPAQVAMALRSSVERAARTVELAGLTEPTVDALPLALVRASSTSWMSSGHDVTIEYIDGEMTWTVVVGDDLRSSTTANHQPSTDGDATVTLAADGEPMTSFGPLAFPDRLRSRFGYAQLATAVGAALGRLPDAIAPLNLRRGPISVPLAIARRAINDPGLTWAVERIGDVEMPAMTTTKRRRSRS